MTHELYNKIIPESILLEVTLVKLHFLEFDKWVLTIIATSAMLGGSSVQISTAL
jgi:hypothetical protein